jgi:hypothetical protein
MSLGQGVDVAGGQTWAQVRRDGRTQPLPLLPESFQTAQKVGRQVRMARGWVHGPSLPAVRTPRIPSV